MRNVYNCILSQQSVHTDNSNLRIPIVKMAKIGLTHIHGRWFGKKCIFFTSSREQWRNAVHAKEQVL
jgi:hypothetical protein